MEASMSVVTTVFIVVGLLSVAVLVWGFRVARSRDGFAELIRRRKTTARISAMAERVDVGNHIPIALTFEAAQIFYEITYMQANLEIARFHDEEDDT